MIRRRSREVLSSKSTRTTHPPRRPGVVTFVWLVALAFFGLNGLWAFLSPRSFFDAAAEWTPYNEHFLRDAGSFSLGIAATLIAGLWRATTTTVLAGAATASSFHAVSHVIDAGQGGRASDPYLLGVLAVVLVLGAVVAWRTEQ